MSVQGPLPLYCEPLKHLSFDFNSNLGQDPDTAFHFNADADLLLSKVMRICDHWFIGPPKLQSFNSDLDQDPDPAFHSNTDPDPAYNKNEDPCGSGST